MKNTSIQTIAMAGALLAVSFQVQSAQSRWYDDATLSKGDALFQQNCASCHKADASGTVEWKKPDANGKYPPPPLNGTAHAWHHDLELLKQTIRDGGAKLGGVMPAFKDKLSDQDIEAVIAYFQSKWPDKVYAGWESRNQPDDIPSLDSAIESKDENKDIGFWLTKRLGKNAFSTPKKTPVDGIYQTEFGSNQGYVTADGRYIFLGNLIDLKTGQNLTLAAQQKFNRAELAKVASSDKAIFPAIGEEKAVLNVFTDTSCPYCKKLHKEVPELQKAGITVEYLPFPRGGKRGPGYQTMRQVWCAKDKARALTIGKGQAKGELPAGNCQQGNMVDRGYALGNRVGVTGTPALFKSNGEKIEGYVPHQKLIPMLLGGRR